MKQLFFLIIIIFLIMKTFIIEETSNSKGNMLMRFLPTIKGVWIVISPYTFIVYLMMW